jgi:hypothetical protein
MKLSVLYYFLLFLMSYTDLKCKRRRKSRNPLNVSTVSIFYRPLLSYFNVVNFNVPIKRAQTRPGDDNFHSLQALPVSAEILKSLITFASRKCSGKFFALFTNTQKY